MTTVLTFFDSTALQPFVKDIFIILLTRLNSSKTAVLVERFVRLFYFLSGKEETGPDFVIQAIDAVQAGIFGQLYTAIVLPDTQKLTRPMDRKVAVVGLTKLIGLSEGLAGTYSKAWANSVVALLKLLEVAPVLSKDDPAESLQAADIDDVSFGATFARLNTCKKKAIDSFPEVQDARKFVGQKLNEANRVTRGKLATRIEGELPDEAKELVKKYMQA
jgi:exportin-2 (importin alpha re-exporter)